MIHSFFLLLCTVVMLSGCSTYHVKVFSYKAVAWNQVHAKQSLQILKQQENHSVVLMSFLQQSRPDAVTVSLAGVLSERQLAASIAYAHDLGLRSIITPLLLVKNTSSDAVNQVNAERWKQWFQSYSAQILIQARLAEQHGADALLVGVDMKHAVMAPVAWDEMIADIRAIFHGQLSYAVRNIKDVKGFSYWRKLDAISILSSRIKADDKGLKKAVFDVDLPVWFIDVDREALGRDLSWADIHKNTSPPWRGFNVLQSRTISWQDEKSQVSLHQLARLGCNAVVFIPFLQQKSAASVQVEKSNAVTDRQLLAGVRRARKTGFHIIIKPQMLVPHSWAGGIHHTTVDEWQQWFASYSTQLLEYAQLAESEGIEVFVIGTELVQAARHVDWPQLISDIRKVFHGRLTYAAHNAEGVRNFPYWNLLDAVSLTLYPSLGTSGDQHDMALHIRQSLKQLSESVEGIPLPVWVMEIGMPSAEDSFEKPWEWPSNKPGHVRSDMSIQKNVLSLWFDALQQPWIDGYFVWAWSSDPDAGGSHDIDYTPQNKPAAFMIKQRWNPRRQG